MHKNDGAPVGYVGAVSSVSGAHCGPRTAEKDPPEQAGQAARRNSPVVTQIVPF